MFCLWVRAWQNSIILWYPRDFQSILASGVFFKLNIAPLDVPERVCVSACSSMCLILSLLSIKTRSMQTLSKTASTAEQYASCQPGLLCSLSSDGVVLIRPIYFWPWKQRHIFHLYFHGFILSNYCLRLLDFKKVWNDCPWRQYENESFLNIFSFSLVISCPIC